MKALDRTTDMHGGEESDSGIVPMKDSNDDAICIEGEVRREGRRSRRTHGATHVPDAERGTRRVNGASACAPY